jgi:Zn-dependent protease
MLFNLVPLAPLDGEKIANYFFPPFLASSLDAIRPFGPAIIILLLFVAPQMGFNFIGDVIYPPVRTLFHLFLFG